MKILIVEDNVPNKLLLYKILKKEGLDVFQSSNGKEALNILKSEKIDAVLTDWMMPEMDGIELIQEIKKRFNPAPAILMITALASRKAHEKAINSGAIEFIEKPYKGSEIISKLNHAVSLNKSGKSKVISEIPGSRKVNYIGVGIAASTGGPSALVEVLKNIRYDSNAVYFVVLHGPAWMLSSFANRLKNIEKLPAILAQDQMKVEAGVIYLAPGDIHMTVDRSGKKIIFVDSPPENFVKPAADPLFKSISESFGKYSVGVVLTGMGKDGSVGAGYISAAGGTVIAQNPDTATLSSMPKSIIDLRIAQEVGDLKKVSELINENVNKLFVDLKN